MTLIEAMVYIYCLTPEQSISDYDWVLVAVVAGETAVKEILCYKNIKKVKEYYDTVKATDHNCVRKFYLKNSCKNFNLYSK